MRSRSGTMLQGCMPATRVRLGVRYLADSYRFPVILGVRYLADYYRFPIICLIFQSCPPANQVILHDSSILKDRIARLPVTASHSTEVCGTVNGSARESSDDEPMDAYSNHLNHHNRRRRPLDPVSRPCSCCCRRCGVRRHDGPAGLLGQLVAQALRQHDPCTVTPQQVSDYWVAWCNLMLYYVQHQRFTPGFTAATALQLVVPTCLRIQAGVESLETRPTLHVIPFNALPCRCTTPWRQSAAPRHQQPAAATHTLQVAPATPTTLALAAVPAG